MAWVNLNAAFGYGTKLTSTQMQNLRDNIAAAFAKDSGAPVLANGYIAEAMFATGAVTADKIGTGAVTAAKIGTSAVTETKIADDAVTSAKIKDGDVKQAQLGTSTTEQSVIGLTGVSFTLPGGTFSHYPSIKCAQPFEVYINPSVATGAVYVTRLWMKNTIGAIYAYVNSTYHTSSGEIYWIFILRDKATREEIAKSCAPDHVCFGNGGKPLLVQHPFGNVLSDNDGFYLLESGKKRAVEIIVLNPEREIIEYCYDKMPSSDPMQVDQNFTEVFNKEMRYTTSSLKETIWPEKCITVGLENNLDWSYGVAKPIKAVIPRPKHVLLGRTKLKN